MDSLASDTAAAGASRDMTLTNPDGGESFDVSGTGFTVLDRVYEDGRILSEELGGSCGNVLISLAMLGWRVAPILSLGADAVGELLCAELASAGACLKGVKRNPDAQTPIIAQINEGDVHGFSFTCPETGKSLPRYRAIDADQVEESRGLIVRSSIFYVDRVTPDILAAMRVAHASGATIVFEPSAMAPTEQMIEALDLSTVVKHSAERIGTELHALGRQPITIVTRGTAGLDVIDRSGNLHLAPVPAATIVDTCGCGDMVTMALIDGLLSTRFDPTRIGIDEVRDAVIAGQRVAAENCAHRGARGVFREKGVQYVANLLKGAVNA